MKESCSASMAYHTCTSPHVPRSERAARLLGGGLAVRRHALADQGEDDRRELALLGQLVDHAEEFHDRTRPAMRDDQWNRIVARTAAMEEVNRQPVDLGRELPDGIEPRLL